MDLLSLPTTVFCDIVGDRLSLEELVRLDSAFCCRDREVWSQRLQSKEFKIKTPVSLVYENQLQWLLIRNVKSANVDLRERRKNGVDVHKDFNTKSLSNYWRLHGHCVRTVRFDIDDIERELNVTVRHCRNLTWVCAEESMLTNTFADLLYYNPNIQKLECDYAASAESSLFEGLSLHKLETLMMRCFDAKEGNLWHESAFSDSLHTVIWEECNIKAADLNALATNCPKLRSFVCSIGNRTGRCLLADCASQLARLVNLSVYCDDSVTDADVLTIATHLTSLRTLNIQHCNTLTDMSLLHVADHLGDKLEMLYTDVKNDESKETEQIMRTFSKKCSKLVLLNINCGDKVLCAGRGTCLLVRGCPALRTLVVESQKTICESSREFIGDRRPDLQLLVDDVPTRYNILSMPIS